MTAPFVRYFHDLYTLAKEGDVSAETTLRNTITGLNADTQSYVVYALGWDTYHDILSLLQLKPHEKSVAS
jgi:hypothetical protein